MTIGEFIRSRPPLEPSRAWTASSRVCEVCFRVSASCFVLSVVLYLGSFYNLHGNGWLAIPYFAGAYVAFAAADHSLYRSRESFWSYERWPFVRGVPMGIKLACLFFFAVVAIHFVLAVSIGGNPEIVDAAYVLVRKGTGIQPISRVEYLFLRAREFRFAVSLGGTIWFNAAACWWLQRRGEGLKPGE